ncbi:T9SS type A sorting domain-containing protein, partial [uncultured Flavobacterium sp.]|uniref:T9SS type A sorting domain-containing protein n=1 Tax=uncultured Flavobacterium sp. TaxID=165435 RepID=UPI0030ECA356
APGANCTFLSTNNFKSDENILIYPNPNNGNFTIQFSSETSNDVNVTVHDLRGRQVYTKSFQNNGLFNQELKLNNASSGIYLVTVQDGNRKEVKKIVVE